MRRALDAAKSKLASLTDRDAILDCFFEHARQLFHFSVLFIVRGDMAYGRNVFGVGAPDGLVARLAFSLDEPGVLGRARELRRPFITTSAMGEGDARLFGSLGRAMPMGLVVPLVVRDRVVAILLADGPVAELAQRAVEAGRPAIELTKEEMLVWSEAVGETLERLILRLKATTGSVPPPRLGSGASTSFSLPPPARVPSFAPPGAPVPSLAAAPPRGGRDLPVSAAAEDPYVSEPPAYLADRRPLPWLPIALVTALVVGAAGFYVWFTKPVDPERIVLAGEKLPGWPASVDPRASLEPLRTTAGLTGKSELASLRAEVGKSGLVDFNAVTTNADGAFLRYVFVTDESEAEVRVDPGGVRAARVQARTVCGGKPCRLPVPLPQCTLAQVWEAAKAAGILDTDRALLTYADGRARDGGGTEGPEWSVAVATRGRVRVDPATCKAVTGQKLMPAAIPLASLPGAPLVDPGALVAVAQAQSGLDADALLLEIDARGVGTAGRVDLNAAESSITYTFADPPAAPGKPRRWREVKVGKEGIPVSSDAGDRTPLPGRFFNSVTPSPACSFGHAYKTAGATAGNGNALARVTYGPDIVSARSGLWTIDVQSLGVRKSITDSECAAWEKLVKKDKP